MIVDLNPSEEQQLIDDSVRDLARRVLPVARLRDVGAWGGAAERLHWNAFADLGLFAMAVPEVQRGLGLGLPEACLAAFALGEHLASPVLIAQMAAPWFAADDTVRAGLMDGSVRAAFANPLPEGRVQALDVEGAHWLLAVTGAGATLQECPSALQAGSGIDETLTLHHAVMGLPATRHDGAAQRLSLLTASYLGGIATAAEVMAVDYAKTREQFGQPIGAFQAIKHQCADMAVRSAAAKAQIFYAATVHGEGSDDMAEVAAARLLARDAALANARTNIQVHGGMGFTAECDAHLFLKRAEVMAALGSSRRAELRRLVSV